MWKEKAYVPTTIAFQRSSAASAVLLTARFHCKVRCIFQVKNRRGVFSPVVGGQMRAFDPQGFKRRERRLKNGRRLQRISSVLDYWYTCENLYIETVKVMTHDAYDSLLPGHHVIYKENHHCPTCKCTFCV